MRPSEYKRFVSQMVAHPKQVKPAIRKAISTKKALNVYRAVFGFRQSTGRLMSSLSMYILGFPISDQSRGTAKGEMGEVMFHLTMLAKEFKVKIPAFTRKSKLKVTPTAALLSLNDAAGALSQQLEVVFEGKEASFDPSTKELIASTLELVYGLSFFLFGKPVLDVVEAHAEVERLLHPERIPVQINRPVLKQAA